MWENISWEIRRVLQLVESWQNGEAPELEKDIVLEKLRELYGQIKFAGHGDEVKETAPAEKEELEQVTLPDEKPDEARALPDAADGDAPDKAENKLFDVEEVPVKTKRDKIILSLYGETAVAAAHEDVRRADAAVHNGEASTGIVSGRGGEIVIPEDIFDDLPVAENAAVTDETIIDAPAAPVHDISVPDVAAGRPVGQKAEPVAGETNKVVLGDVIHKNGKTIADTYAEHNHNTDMATKISTENVMELRKAIGINDKFLMVRDIFGGDTAAFDAAIDDLERFTDLDEALIHIHDHYSWNPNSGGVKLLIDILTKKLS